MKQVQLILAGGFLGAGKTTLLERTARRLMEQGRRVGLVTNDQAPELVDSEMLRQGRLAVAEVAGSCFCCNFNGLVDALKKLGEMEVLAWRCLQPGRPNPTYRFGEVVSA